MPARRRPRLRCKLADVLAKLPKIAPRADHKQAIQALAFSPQTRLIAVGRYGSVQLLDASHAAAGAGDGEISPAR